MAATQKRLAGAQRLWLCFSVEVSHGQNMVYCPEKGWSSPWQWREKNMSIGESMGIPNDAGMTMTIAMTMTKDFQGRPTAMLPSQLWTIGWANWSLPSPMEAWGWKRCVLQTIYDQKNETDWILLCLSRSQRTWCILVLAPGNPGVADVEIFAVSEWRIRVGSFLTQREFLPRNPRREYFTRIVLFWVLWLFNLRRERLSQTRVAMLQISPDRFLDECGKVVLSAWWHQDSKTLLGCGLNVGKTIVNLVNHTQICHKWVV